MKRLNLIGKKFNDFTVLSVFGKDKNGHLKYIVKCSCGNEKIVYGTHLVRNKTKSCGHESRKGPKHLQWTGYEGISGNWWSSHIGRYIKPNGSKRNSRVNISVTITKKEMWELFLKQNKKCALSGLDITIENKKGTASIDRIDPKKGYVLENVQWVHKDLNRMKNIFSESYFIEICKLVAKTRL